MSETLADLKKGIDGVEAVRQWLSSHPTTTVISSDQATLAVQQLNKACGRLLRVKEELERRES